MSADNAYNTYKAASGELVDSLIGGSALNYVGHRACVRGASSGARRDRMHVKLVELAIQKEIAGNQDSNHLHRATRDGAWLSDAPHRLNYT